MTDTQTTKTEELIMTMANDLELDSRDIRVRLLVLQFTELTTVKGMSLEGAIDELFYFIQKTFWPIYSGVIIRRLMFHYKDEMDVSEPG
jgi:hypothetical protein